MPACGGTHCAASSMRSSSCCAPAVPGCLGATCLPTSLPGRRCTITFSSFVARASGPISGASYAQLNVGGWARIPIQVRPSWTASRVKTVEESARIRGIDAHKHVKGRKRHILVDTLGLPLSVYVTPADMHDVQGARRLLAGMKYVVPRLMTNWADAAYRGLPRPRARRLVQSAGRLGSGSGRAGSWGAWIRRCAQALDRRTDVRMAVALPSAEQGLRAQSADERNTY
jgi:Transposase DDE domain